ncbi:hypothetical protein BDW59DRAFT_174288 [Aspergillus cavernicola]|uniref:Uncharacterized protein n=1 Tax=Aspergillus cavernicola TaxID=176166 RepID=A0ABR4HZN3_9EURO
MASPTQPPKNPRERALAIKKVQEEALARLSLDTLYILLFIRTDPPQPHNFHWGYYFHTSPNGGFKYHAKTLDDGWIPDHSWNSGIFKSDFLCVLIQIASVPQGKHGLLDQVMRSRDGDVNSIPGITCRVWLLVILQALVQQGIVHCGDIDAFQQDCMDFGNQHSDEAANNQQPRPVVRSRVCF